MLQYAVYVTSASSSCGFGRHGVLLSVSAVNNAQFAFRKFHLLAGLPAIGRTSDGTLMIGGRWCDWGNLSMMRRSGFGFPAKPAGVKHVGIFSTIILSSSAPIQLLLELQSELLPSILDIVIR